MLVECARKMRRTRKAETLSSTKNIGTQTEFESSEIAKLQEQLKLLQLQIDNLTQHTKTSDKFNDSTQYKQFYTPEIKSNIKKCNCKGNCSSRICGCVKRNNICNSSCSCKYNTCQNQKSENDENDTKNNIDEAVETSKNFQTNNENLMAMVDFRKPRRLLEASLYDIKIEKNNTETHQGESSFQDIKEEEVDWQQHIAQLIRCKKCKRTFMPHRIQKHEACCKGI